MSFAEDFVKYLVEEYGTTIELALIGRKPEYMSHIKEIKTGISTVFLFLDYHKRKNIPDKIEEKKYQ
jgi:hypothetical protein